MAGENEPRATRSPSSSRVGLERCTIGCDPDVTVVGLGLEIVQVALELFPGRLCFPAQVGLVLEHGPTGERIHEFTDGRKGLLLGDSVGGYAEAADEEVVDEYADSS